MSLAVRAEAAGSLAAAVDIARLRIPVFAGLPCLGDCAAACENHQKLVAAGGAMKAGCDGMRIVRTAPARPVPAQHAEFRVPFEALAAGIASLFCFAENGLFAEHSGCGITHTFRHRREQAPLEGLVTRLTRRERDEPEENPEQMQCQVREI
jgi:hypothetical protein